MKRIIRLSGAFALSLGLLAGPLADLASARHRQNYPPAGEDCKIDVTRKENKRRIVTRIKVICKGVGVVSKEIRIVYKSDPLYVGTFTTDATGAIDATIPVPDSLPPGAHHLEIFEADSVDVPAGAPPVVADDQAVPAVTLGNPLKSIPLEVKESDGKKTVLAGSSLPTQTASADSSSSKAPLTAAAVGLAGIGATGLVVARRRRSATDAGDS